MIAGKKEREMLEEGGWRGGVFIWVLVHADVYMCLD